MGIAGHILGERKLRALQRWSGIDFDRAYNRNGSGGARVIENGECRHYWVDFRAQTVEADPWAFHWYSCPQRIIDLDRLVTDEEAEKYGAIFTEGAGMTSPTSARVVVRIVEPEEN